MNINIFDEKIEVPCGMHNDVDINKNNYDILINAKNIITWIDAK